MYNINILGFTYILKDNIYVLKNNTKKNINKKIIINLFNNDYPFQLFNFICYSLKSSIVYKIEYGGENKTNIIKMSEKKINTFGINSGIKIITIYLDVQLSNDNIYFGNIYFNQNINDIQNFCNLNNLIFTKNSNIIKKNNFINIKKNTDIQSFTVSKPIIHKVIVKEDNNNNNNNNKISIITIYDNNNHNNNINNNNNNSLVKLIYDNNLNNNNSINSLIEQTNDNWEIIIINISDNYLYHYKIMPNDKCNDRNLTKKIKIINICKWKTKIECLKIGIINCTQDIIGILDYNNSLDITAIDKILNIYNDRNNPENIMIYANILNKKNIKNKSFDYKFYTFKRIYYYLTKGYDNNNCFGYENIDILFKLEKFCRRIYINEYLCIENDINLINNSKLHDYSCFLSHLNNDKLDLLDNKIKDMYINENKNIFLPNIYFDNIYIIKKNKNLNSNIFNILFKLNIKFNIIKNEENKEYNDNESYIYDMINILDDANKNNYNKILIIDDDTILHKNFIEEFDKKCRLIPYNWDILFLGYNSDDNLINILNNFDIKYNIDYDFKNESYCIGYDNSIYKDLLNELKLKLNTNSYKNIFEQFINNSKINKYLFYPPIVINDITRHEKISNENNNIIDFYNKNFEFCMINLDDFEFNLYDLKCR